MSTRTSIAMVVILTARLLTFEVKADCLDGHLEDFRISSHLYADTQWTCNDFAWSETNGSGEIECFDFCCGVDSCPECPGPRADFSVTTSPNGYTITAHAQVRDGQNLQITYASVCVHAWAVGGEVSCTPQGADKQFANGEVFETPIEADPEEPTESYCLECGASGWDTPGGVTCTLTVTCTPTVSSRTRYWASATGGAYEVATNWAPGENNNYCAPAHDAQRSDTAWFALPTASHIPVTAGGLATAKDWEVRNSAIEFNGSAQVFSTSPPIHMLTTSGGGAPPPGESLRIREGGQLRLASGASLDSVHASIGASGATNSGLEVNGASWTNTGSTKIGRGSVDVLDGGTASTGALSIGAGNGPATVHVTGDASSFDVTGALVVGDTTAGTLEIEKGLFSNTSLSTPPVIGKSAPGTVTVRGDDSNLNSHGRLQTNHTLIVGDGAGGRLNVQRGGHVSVAQDLVVGGYGANPAGEVVVDAQGGVNMLDVSGGIFVNATELREILVENGGRVTTNDLFIGNRQLRPGSADVTLRGSSGNFPTLTVGIVGGGGEGTFVGDEVPGQLNIQGGARAELNNGLYVGAGGQGIVIVSGPAAPPQPTSTLTVTGETQVGLDAPGIVQLDLGAAMDTNGDLTIGMGGGNPSGSVTVQDTAFLRVNGALSVGATGTGLLNILTGSGVRCDTLMVGRDTPAATGIITLTFFTSLTVDGNAQVGVAAGRGEILLADPEASMTVNGTMTIGNPGGGPGGGTVALVDARINGTGNILVNPNGSLVGTGTVAVPHIAAGGVISPGLSPGTLTIEGDLDMLPGGKLIIEYAGLNPGEFDVLHVTGQTTLGGRLEVHFRGGFSPSDPQAFIYAQSFVEADQGITGDYDQRIYAYPDIFADFEDDGDKDLSDVAAFQNCFGLSGAELDPTCEHADWEGDGVIGGREIQELITRLTGP